MNQYDDLSIPLLTDVIRPDAPNYVTSSNSSDTSVVDWEFLEQQIYERVLKQLQGRVDFVLEHRIQENLAGILHNAVDQLADQIRIGLQATLKEIVSLVLKQEIDRTKVSKDL